MSKEEIIEGNSIIATFMGAVIVHGWEAAISPMWHFKSKPSFHPDHWHTNNFQAEYMLYHLSYDWIMPVVEKIERLDNADTVIIIQDDTCTIYGGDFNLVVDEYNKIDSVWEACVEFCKWYKENKND